MNFSIGSIQARTSVVLGAAGAGRADEGGDAVRSGAAIWLAMDGSSAIAIRRNRLRLARLFEDLVQLVRHDGQPAL